jgi:alkaline phosphatase D
VPDLIGWEFVAGPLHAGTFGPNALGNTFGPEVKYQSIPRNLKPRRPPSDGLQFFGTVRIDAKTETLHVGLHNLAGKTMHTVDVAAKR